jgi:phosphoribosylanthranilate isomerase
MFIKICGIRDVEELKFIEKYADATGVVVECESKRQISHDKAKKLIEAARIPVFMVSTLDRFEHWAELIMKTEANFLQIHTDLSPKDVERIKSEFDVHIMKTFKVPEVSMDLIRDAERLIEKIESYEIDSILLDTGSGSGITHDHRVSSIVAEEFDIILAGGLNPKNVVKAVKTVKPYGVDVSSGVEKNGRKDRGLVEKFVKVLEEFK